MLTVHDDDYKNETAFQYLIDTAIDARHEVDLCVYSAILHSSA
jgi:hypothetical protein